MAKLTGKVALVTGASKGIGAGIAKALAAEGAAVAVNYSSSREGAEKVVKEIEAAGGKAFAVGGSVSKAADVEKIYAETKKALGPVDVLVNNAGVYEFAPLEQIDEKHFRRQFDTNVLGLLLASQGAARHFGDKGGVIVNIGSLASDGRFPNMAVYAGTKGAVDSITNILATELAPRKIRVNSVNPGYVPTEGNAFMKGSEVEQGMLKTIPLGRAGTVGDIGAAVVYLASDDASWVTGEVLKVGGGSR